MYFQSAKVKQDLIPNDSQLQPLFYRSIGIPITMRSFLKNKPLFIFLLPVFFVFHGFVEHYYFISAKDTFLLILLYTITAFIITGLAWFFYKDFIKAALVSFYLLCFFLFFGSVQDFLREHFTGTFFSRYSFILPFMFLLFVLLVVWLKKSRVVPYRIVYYLNILLLLLILIDIGFLGKRIALKKRSAFDLASFNMNQCSECPRPDIYFIILDEYAGNRELKEFFNFNNSIFEQQLKQRGFHISEDSRSNYNYTPFSIASILNMNYLNLNMQAKAAGNIDYCYQQIKNSAVVNYLSGSGYKFYNYSIFNFEGQLAVRDDNFFPNRTALITSQTFFSRIMNDIRFNIGTGKWKFKTLLDRMTYEPLHNNKKILRLTKEIASEKTSAPKFVYTHLMMPHYPYYFNSKGESLPIEQLYEGQETNKVNYVEYLQYCNIQILQLIDDILSTSKEPPVIMLLGDHGFRHVIRKEEHKYAFMNLNATYLPDKNYNQFYDSISNVNQFRVFLNTEFKQQLPLLKDSTVYLWDN